MKDHKRKSFVYFNFIIVFLGFFGSSANNQAFAVACDANNTRYSISSNRIYLENGADCTLEEVSALYPAQLTRTENGVGDIFFLRVNLFIEDGSTLKIFGPAAAGEVGMLRLLSNNSKR